VARGHVLGRVDEITVLRVGPVPDGLVQLPVAHLAVQAPGPTYVNSTVLGRFTPGQ
jgi:hypothetical protein